LLLVLTSPVRPTLLYEARLFWYNRICRLSLSTKGSLILTTLTHILQADETEKTVSAGSQVYIFPHSISE